LNIKGIGPKKISTIWNEMQIESLGELLYACNENRLTLYKGFGEKTQQGVKESIEFYMGTLGSYLYQQIESFATTATEKLQKEFTEHNFIITGEFKRQLEIVEKLEWVSTVPTAQLVQHFTTNEFEIVTEIAEYVSFKGKENVTLGFHYSAANYIYKK